MKPLPKDTLQQIRNILREAGAGYFQSDEESEPGQFLCDTRDNGDVGSETPGERDIAAARKAQGLLKARFPNATVTVETVDEWTHLHVNFPPEMFLGDEAAKTLFHTCVDQTVIPLLEAAGCKTTTKEEFQAKPDRNQDIQFGTDIAGSSLFAEHRQSPHEYLRWTEPKIRVRAFTERHSEYVEIQLDSKVKKEEITSTEGIPAALTKATQALLLALQENGEFRNDLWSRVPQGKWQEILANIPQYQVVGNGGYEGPWESSVFYALPDGDYLLADGEEVGKPTALWNIPRNQLQEAIRALTDEFYPKVPEKAIPLATLIHEITQKIKTSILEEAKTGTLVTLEKYGAKGTLIQAVNGDFYLEPPKQETKA